MDEDNDRHVCPICWNIYKKPKLLKCRHTFCTKCLEKLVESGKDARILKCPVCRSNVQIPKNGIAGYMDNYFVRNTERKMDNVRTKCDMCNQNNCSTNRVCPHCNQTMCLSCSSSHKKALILSGSSIPSSESDTEDEDERGLSHRRNSSEHPVPFHVAASVDLIKYVKILGMISSISLDFCLGEDGMESITCISPISDIECYAVPLNGPTIFRYDISGNIKDFIRMNHDFVTSIEYQKDGSLLITTNKSHRILKYFAGKLTTFASTNDLIPCGLSSFPDGRIAIVGLEKTKFDRCGRLQILSADGTVMETFGEKNDRTLFKDPASVSVNKHSFIFVGDRVRRRVVVLSDNGAILNQYLGGKNRFQHPVFTREMHFDPICVRADVSGNVIVNDLSLGCLHLLDPNGNFIGLVVANQSDEFGHPFSFAIDSQDKIWLGDISDMKIRVYECKVFLNYIIDEKVNNVCLPLRIPADLPPGLEF